MADYILSLDQGTTSSRAIVFDHTGNLVAQAQKEFQQYFPQPGWVEHDAKEIWSSQLLVTEQALNKASLSAKDIAAIGITNQRETTVVWNRRTGKPIYHAIVWQDRRTAKAIDALKARGLAEMIQGKTGLVLDAYFSASKIAWILEHVEGARAQAEAGELAFGTVDSWLLWNLSGGQIHSTDISNACRTLLFNIKTRSWDQELLDLFGIPASMMPAITSCSEVVAHSQSSLFGAEIPIAGRAGDQQAATFGQACFAPGQAKNTYGTGCFVLLNTGADIITSKNQLLSTVAYQLQGQTNFALEGSVFVAGAVVQWLRDELGIINRSADVEALATSISDNGGVYMAPAFAGLGAPHWDQYARGSILGLSRGSSAAHIARAALESIAYQSLDVLTAMQADAGSPINELRVDGGVCVNDFLMQFQADILDVPVLRPKVTETTALGAAYLAGLAVGYWHDTEEIAAQWQLERRFEPNMAAEQREELLSGWHKAVDRAKAWAED